MIFKSCDMIKIERRVTVSNKQYIVVCEKTEHTFILNFKQYDNS